MTTEEIIAGVTPIKVTRTAPKTVTVVDETAPKPESQSLPVDAGKRKVEIPSIPGLSLVLYPRGYVALQIKGKDFHGRRVTVGKPLYREQIKDLVEQLFAMGDQAKTYEEANGSVPF